MSDTTREVDAAGPRNGARRAIGILAVLLGAGAAAFGVYALLLTRVFVPAGLVPVEVSRTVERAALLRELAAGSSRPVLVFGSSVVLEGVDASLVERALPSGVPVYNIAESSAGLRNLMMNMVPVCGARPRLLVCCLRRTQLSADYYPALPSELLIGYAYADYVDTANREPAWIYERLTEEEKRSLPGNEISKLLASRVFLMRSLEERLRHRSRPDLRGEGFSTNFRDPWRYTRQMPEDRLSMFIERSRSSFSQLRFDPESRIADTLKACLRYSRSQGVPFVLVISAEHPLIQAVIPAQVRREFDAGVMAACRSEGGRTVVMDASQFTASEFLDHSHVNGKGREVFSRLLGTALADVLED